MLRSVIQVVLFRPLWYNFAYGALAQLIERSIRIAEVAGLIPARSTYEGLNLESFLFVYKMLCYNGDNGYGK